MEDGGVGVMEEGAESHSILFGSEYGPKRLKSLEVFMMERVVAGASE